MKKVIIILLIVLTCIGIGMGLVFRNISKNLDSYINGITIEQIDLMKIPDGVYRGTADAVIVMAEVEITVKDHVIINIDLLEHRNGRGKDGEKVIAQILEKQRVDVDAISGATYSSLLIRDAVQKALLGAVK
ncbi:MAG: FMN-binding protein [Spirochaetia bacterium]|nr:FMN-binding protein [Spirochaetia bacterium]